MKPQPTITIKDIARKFKCSPSTVSRALNDSPLISIDTRNTIQEYAQKMGYQRNSVSLSLLQKSTKNLGVILPSISHYHEYSMVEGLQSVLQPLGYLLNICVTNESYELEREYIERLLANRVDGIFISISQETYDEGHDKHLKQALSRGVPLLFMDRRLESMDADTVTIDDYQGAWLATEHLIKVGCRRIAHLRGPVGLTVSEQRFKGYQDCLLRYSLQLDSSFVCPTTFQFESAIEPTQWLINRPNRPDGIFGVNDQVCFGALKVIREQGLSVPQDCAVVGFDNTPFSQYSFPSLSSVGRQSRHIGVEAAHRFLDQFENDIPTQNIVLPPELIIRESTQR
ncbi:MAG: LacI family DNA-binding transcriptional regulator [Spirosomataceae bacterium]